MRDKPNNKAKIATKITNGEFVFISDEESNANWIKVYAENNSSGYIHKSRIKLITKLPSLKNKLVSTNRCNVFNDTILVTVRSMAFNPKLHSFTYYKDEKGRVNKDVINKIDGHSVWGEDGGMPKTEFLSIRVSMGDVNISLPKSTFKDVYQPNYNNLNVYLGDGNTIYIKMDNSDGAGYYTVIWTIIDGKYINRYIDNIEA
ncbi:MULTISPECIES: SH3 domain-containing protein [unclassified Mucilaginibacter]|uniref:SH3 domain-containing protein n=1 Tax=unclassified Mucilaginibacter TaxID=2617802 RepID=UPI002AC941A7|nr:MULTISPECIES: SH3 domain-containing protein [unclassified Mucilaginibacter]MEB0260186.1 SH3 domain-containing protein [Mucilaginibacter sp. 10I4]MEB0277403.1 SH3 domain-containing protein [Mucilaginibacter sp. 10B2]MEB0300115.1 SH3 domain-containing protein [Mucilaginibacter sp. 5C4]WPX25527.1 SH3 domain-containing protein [Mucilaginibacter sp. 5C4]